MFSKTLAFLVSFVALCSLPWAQSADKPRYTLQNTKSTFFEALRKCEAIGLQLASITSAQDNAQLKKIIGSQVGPWWTAGTDLGEEMKFIWLTSQNPFGFRNGYTNWAAGQPEGPDTNENCVIAGFPAGAGVTGWKDEPCETKYKFICEPRPSNWKPAEIPKKRH